MRDFTIKDIATEIAKDYPYISEKVILKICKESLNNIMKIMKKGKAQIHLRHADIHSIYQEIDVRAIFADLDEARMLTGEQLELSKYQELAGKGIYSTRVRGRGKVKRVYNTRHSSHPVYAGQYPEGSLGDVRESSHNGEKVYSDSKASGERDIQEVPI